MVSHETQRELLVQKPGVRGDARHSSEEAQRAQSIINRHEDDALALVVYPADQPIRAHADPDRVGQIVANLVENALKYAGLSATVSIGTIGDHAWLIVADDGPGIAPEVLPQVTAPFLTTKDGHVGVGLTRVETLLDMYGLAWDLRSEPGAGTTVTIEVAEALTETPHGDVPRGGPVAENPCET